MKTKQQIQEQINQVVRWVYDFSTIDKFKKIYGEKLLDKLLEDWADFGDWVYDEGDFKK